MSFHLSDFSPKIPLEPECLGKLDPPMKPSEEKETTYRRGHEERAGGGGGKKPARPGLINNTIPRYISKLLAEHCISIINRPVCHGGIAPLRKYPAPDSACFSILNAITGRHYASQPSPAARPALLRLSPGDSGNFASSR